jgi:cytochrome c oxidase subunit 2
LDAADFGSLTGEQMEPSLNTTTYHGKPIFYLFIGLIALLLAGCHKKSQDAVPSRVIAVTMKKGDISPKQIRVKQHETVELNVLTLDVQHGFEIPELDISEPVNPGKPAEIVLTADEKGTFKVECGIMCGAHHDDMRAELVVE